MSTTTHSRWTGGEAAGLPGFRELKLSPHASWASLVVDCSPPPPPAIGRRTAAQGGLALLGNVLSRCAALEARLAVLDDRVTALAALRPREVLVREVPAEEAKRAILAYYESHPGDALYPSDVAADLSLSAAFVRDLVNELVDEGKLK
jgi:hypothetical protein